MSTDPDPELLKLPDEEIIKIYVEQLGMSEDKARFVLGMQRGTVGPNGDVVEVGSAEDPG